MLKYDNCACGERKQARCKTCATCQRKTHLQEGQTLRSQAELVTRIVAAAQRHAVEEINEYMTQVRRQTYKTLPVAMTEGHVDHDFISGFVAMYSDVPAEIWREQESNASVSNKAYQYLPFLERAARRRDARRTASIAAQFRAWKWLLGHSDADIFFDTRNYAQPWELALDIASQFKTGEWYRLTVKGQSNETGQTPTATATA